MLPSMDMSGYSVETIAALKKMLREGTIVYQRYRCVCGHATNRYRDDGKCPNCGLPIADNPTISQGGGLGPARS